VILGKHALMGMAAFAAAVLVTTLVLLPPLPAASPSPSWRLSLPEVRGVFHVHTRRSDGTGSVDDVAAAAARDGLQFVILTDHGDGTREPDPPAYRSGVLCIDAVEISTTGGHYAAIGLGRAPYPLAGEPRDVAEDVRRLGGFGVATHPLSTRPSLAWTGWDVPFDGLEWLNGDSLWRDAPLLRLAAAAWTYAYRPAASMGELYQRPAALGRWDALLRGRHVVALAGTDAHARLGFRDGPEPYVNPVFVRVPSYETALQVASLRVRLAQPLSRSAARDADAIVAAIRAGRVHSVVDALAGPASFEISARSGGVSAAEGDDLPLTDPVVVRVRANPPAGGWIALFRDGQEVHRVAAGELTYASDRPGAYRAEVSLPVRGGDELVPWIVSNPIYAGGVLQQPAVAAADTKGPAFQLEAANSRWGVEHDAQSVAVLERQGTAIALRYALGTWRGAAPYAALNATTPIDVRATGIAFQAYADRPMRLSVQLRVPAGGEGKRWRRSVYLEQAGREVVVPFAELTPVGSGPLSAAELAAVRTVLFVVDTVNARPGASGRFVLEGVHFFSPGTPIR
jgi:hypothetical protein